MGEVKHNLATEDFRGEQYFKDMLRVEVSEAIHLHWRDVRILLTPDQFAEFFGCVQVGFQNWKGVLEDIDTILAECKIPNNILLDPVVSIEEQVNGCVHFHYKDIRIEMPQDMYVKMALLFERSKVSYFKEREVNIKLLEIDEYDNIHKPTLEGWLDLEGYSEEHLEKDYHDHIKGIDWMSKYISEGFKINPILVTKLSDPMPPYKYVRRDGYKRFKAYELLGEETIPCYVVSEEVALIMPQNKEFPFRGFSK